MPSDSLPTHATMLRRVTRFIAPAAAAAAIMVAGSSARATLPPTPPSCSFGTPGKVPQSGVVVARPDFGIGLNLLLDRLDSVDASWDDGTAVDGTLEVLTLREIDEQVAPPISVWVWRPAAPLDRTGTLTITFDYEGDGACAGGPKPASIEVVDDPGEPFVAPELRKINGVVDARDLVCCDGAMPRIAPFDSGGVDHEITWDRGYCLLPRSLDQGSAELVIEGDAVDPLLVDQWIVQLWDDQELITSGFIDSGLWLSYDRSFASQLEYHHLGTGEVVVGPDVALPGELRIDDATGPENAWQGLDARCVGTPYRCATPIGQGQWDPSSCIDVDLARLQEDAAGPKSSNGGSGGTVSCSVGSGGSSGAGLLALGFLLLVRRQTSRTRAGQR